MISPEINPFEDDGLSSNSAPFSFATVASVHTDGLSLIFPNENASQKHYLCNQYCKFAAGQKVLVTKVSGTYVALCPIGTPSGNVAADTAARADTANIATGVANNDDGSMVLFSANSTDGNYYMWNQKSAWKRINNP